MLENLRVSIRYGANWSISTIYPMCPLCIFYYPPAMTASGRIATFEQFVVNVPEVITGLSQV